MNPSLLSLVSALSIAIVVPPAIAQEPNGTLGVTKVVLFSSGVGYFEHHGTVEGNAASSFVFQSNQINDVLKSMVLRDSSGSVSAINYPSQDPLDRALKSFAVDLSGFGGLASLLPQFRGVEMTLSTPGEVTGRLVGVEPVEKIYGTGNASFVQKDSLVALSTKDGLRSIPLSTVSGIKLLDQQLNDELSKALSLLASSRDNQRKTVEVRFVGTGKREVSVGYVSEAPVWKTSYRVDLTGDKPYLQGWAIVENTSETDWNGVRLSLVSGRPVSFVQDLYSPLYVQRPIYKPEIESGPAPQIHSSGMAAPAPVAAAAPSRRKPASIDLLAKEVDRSAVSESADDLRNSGIDAAATGEKAGELFQFTVKTPVSLSRRQSAMLPLTAGEIKAEKVSLYNAQVLSKHPQNAVVVTNTTGLRLPAGPITVFDGGIYAGDALTETLVENDQRIWTYATDLGVLVDSSAQTSLASTKISIVKGVVQFKREYNASRTYRIQNKATSDRTILIEHPYLPQRTLVQPAKYDEKTESLYRFRTSVASGKTQDFVVSEKEIQFESQGIVSSSSNQIFAYVNSSGSISAAVKTALQKAAELLVKAERAQQEIVALDRQKNEAESNQSRYRSNIETVGRDSPQGQSYLKKLMDSEATIEKIEQSWKEKQDVVASTRKDLESYLLNLNVE